jgi:diguanylate cyclase (GGDEF)-like protein/PAS domain S-box-containing protein
MTLLLSGLLALATALLLAGVAANLMLRKWRADQQSKCQLRELLDAAIEGLVICENGAIKDTNAGFARLVGFTQEQLHDTQFVSFISPEYRDRFGRLSAEPEEMELIPADQTRIPVEVTVRENLDQVGSRRIYAVHDVRERKRAEARIRYLAHHDPLTGIPNRTVLNEQLSARLERAWGNDEQFAVISLDLDRFKEVNDVFGHASGDAVLREATRRMRSVLGPEDVITRLGGDEFAIVTGRCDPGRAIETADRLIAAISKDFTIGEKKTSVGLSIGIALFPSHGTTPERLLTNADVALYRAKAQGRGLCCFFNSEMDSAIRDRRALANDLGQALERGELDLHYQPQATVSSLAVRGFEALARWRHIERGFIPPGEFVTLAEENGLVHELGLWVLRQACTEAAKWKSHLGIAVNISALQFQHGDLPHDVIAILSEAGLSPSRLELEITETVLIKDFDRALSMLRRLKALGLRIAMDDFGTGWSSLSTLQAFPFDRLKIDRTFVDKIGRNREADVIVRAVLALGRSLNIPVLAEGVETQHQLDFLRQESCEEMQGYLLARPAPIITFPDLLVETELQMPQLGKAEGADMADARRALRAVAFH